VLIAWLFAAGCGQSGERIEADRRAQASDSSVARYALEVDVFADSTRSMPLHVEPPAARIWMSRVTPASLDAVPLPSGGTDTVAAPSMAAAMEPPATLDAPLVPPILKERAQLVVPSRLPRGVSFVELDVRVDESGAVSEARWAGGSEDSVLVRSATECARRMRFLPALRGGNPVAVWSRQRFEFRR